MRFFVLLVLLLFLLGCAQPMDVPRKDVLIEDFDEEALVIKEKPEPLELIFTVTPETGEVPLNIEASCSGKGGVEPYAYQYQRDGEQEAEGTREIKFTLDKVGRYSITCIVSDQNETRNKTITIEVTKKREKVDTIITLGDSLTYGHGLTDPLTQDWPALLGDSYPDAVVTNLAFSGSTSWGTREQMLALQNTSAIEEGDTKLVFLWVGANDIARFIPLEDFETNIDVLLTNLTALPNSRVVLLTIPDASKLPVAGAVEEGVNALIAQFGGQYELKVRDISKEIIDGYNNILAAKAKEYDLLLIDMFSFLEAFPPDHITEDQFHPNEKGHVEVKKKIEEELLTAYPDTEFY